MTMYKRDVKPTSNQVIQRSAQTASRHPIVALAVLVVLVVACRSASKSDEMTVENPAVTSELKQPTVEPVVLAAAYEKRWEDHEFVPELTSSCFYCHETLSRRYGRPARHHVTSAHFRAGVTCFQCHGGDPMQDEMEDAHNLEEGFVGKLEFEEMTKNCAQCHQTAVDKFIGSKHFPEHESVRQVTCIECHGSHDIGARPNTIQWTKTCLDCHALDQVPDLPQSLLDMMASKDEVHDALRKLRYEMKNAPFPDSVMERYRVVRQLSADTVHSTTAQDIDERMKAITEKNTALANSLAAMTVQR